MPSALQHLVRLAVACLYVHHDKWHVCPRHATPYAQCVGYGYASGLHAQSHHSYVRTDVTQPKSVGFFGRNDVHSGSGVYRYGCGSAVDAAVHRKESSLAVAVQTSVDVERRAICARLMQLTVQRSLRRVCPEDACLLRHSTKQMGAGSLTLCAGRSYPHRHTVEKLRRLGISACSGKVSAHEESHAHIALRAQFSLILPQQRADVEACLGGPVEVVRGESRRQPVHERRQPPRLGRAHHPLKCEIVRPVNQFSSPPVGVLCCGMPCSAHYYKGNYYASSHQSAQIVLSSGCHGAVCHA